MISMRIDMREFNQTLAKYMALSKRTPKEITDKKALFVARRAIRETQKTEKAKIERELGVMGHKVKQITRGKNKGKFRRAGYLFDNSSLAERLVRAWLHKKGEPQPDKTGIEKFVKKLIAYRLRSIAFLRSAWIPAIKILGPLVKGTRGAAPRDGATKQYKRDKGTAKPASANWRAVTSITNMAEALHQTSGMALAVLKRGLQAALDYERKSMLVEIERRLREDAKRAGIRTA